MRTTTGLLLAGLMAFGARGANAATCTVTRMQVLVTNFGFAPDLPPLVGYQIPVDVDEAAGTIRFDLTNVPNADFAIAGTVSTLQPSGAAYSGTLDAAGAITVPDVDVDFVVQVDGTPHVMTTATLATGIGANLLQKRDYPSIGSNLDFATGNLTIAGAGVIPDAPLAGIPVVAGLSIGCTLSPIPDPSKLPAGLSLTKASARGKFGKAKKNVTVPGDTLTVKGTLIQGATPIDPQSHDFFLRIGGDTEFLLVRVPANTLQAKSKSLTLTDGDGSLIHVVDGQKQIGNDVAALGGTLVLHFAKKGTVFMLKETGLDLCKAPTTASTLTVSLGTTGASTAVTVKRAGKSTCK